MKINKNITTVNRWIGRDGNQIEWIVLHYTANTYQPDLAKNECAMFKDVYRGASAHYFVDTTSIWQCVELDDTAWHCGDNPPSKNGCTNRNSIGIEMCNVYENGVYSIADKTADNAVWLVCYLLELYPNAKICRHYDVTGKRCPAPWVDDSSLWLKFKERVEEERPMTPAEKKEFDALKATVKAQAKAISKLQLQDVNFTEQIKAMQEFDTDVTKGLNALNERTKARYQSVDDCPKWAQPTVSKLVDEGALKGDEKGLDLTDDLTRTLVIVDRAGGFDHECVVGK